MPKGWRVVTFHSKSMDKFDELHIELIGYARRKLTLSQALELMVDLTRKEMSRGEGNGNDQHSGQDSR